MTARWPLLVVTRGAERRSTPFFWFSALTTTWNCGSVKTPLKPKMPGASELAPGMPKRSASSALAVMARLPLRLPPVTGNPPTGAPPGGTNGKSFGLTAGPVPEVPPPPKTRFEPGTLNWPNNQSKPSSFRLFCVISTNFASISTCFGPETLACSTRASTNSRFSSVLRTIKRLLCGRKLALAPVGKGTPWSFRKSSPVCLLTSCWPPVDSSVSLAGSGGADSGGPLIERNWRRR